VRAVTDPIRDHGYHRHAMHLIILLLVGIAMALVVARVFATPNVALRDEVSLPWALVAGLAIGIFAAVAYISTQVDLVPDDVEAGAVPYVIIGVSAALLLGVGYRALRP